MTKRGTSDVQTFVSADAVWSPSACSRSRVHALTCTGAHAATPAKGEVGQVLPRVDVIYAHAGMCPDVIDGAVANGAKGLVIAGVGGGNMTTPALDAVKRAIGQGVTVVRSTRVGDRHGPPQHRGRRQRTGRHRRSKELSPSKGASRCKLAR